MIFVFIFVKVNTIDPKLSTW